MKPTLKYSEAKAYITTPDKTKLHAPVAVTPGTASGAVTITVNETHAAQKMHGFGAALTDSSAYILAKLPAAKRNAVLRDLFDTRTGGIGFSVLRICIGASDFTGRGNFSYDDLPAGQTDPDQKHFSIHGDEAYVLPVLRQILKINPSITIIASPWSAPAWMKTSKTMNGGWLDWSAYAAYAKYLTKFIQAYNKAGVPIHYLTVQNEPRNGNSGYPTMQMEPKDQARFVGDHLGPEFKKAGLHAKILIWDHNWDAPDFPLVVLADAKARQYISGVAWHAYAGKPEAQDRVRKAFPSMETHFTESSGGDFAPGFGGNVRWDVSTLIIGSTQYGASTVLKWNLVLDPQHGPRNGGCQDCRAIVTIDPATGQVTKNEEYYAFGHASKFVRAGARRVEAQGTNDLAAGAFVNPNGSLVVVAANNDTTHDQTVQINSAKRSPVNVIVPAGATVTVVL